MHRDPVDSSVIRSIGYDEGRRVLEVEFRTGRLYQYLGVPPAVYRDLLRAESIGEFFNHQVRREYRAVEITSGSK